MTTEKIGVIYRIWNRDTGQSYIGQTIQPIKQRISTHFNINDNYYLHRAIQSHGIDAFEWEVIESDLYKSLLDKRETYWINQFDCIRPNGYNLTLGGEGTHGFKHSDDTKKKMSAIKKGKKASAETRVKLSESRRGEKNPNYGKKFSDEHRKKISDNHANTWKGRKHKPESRQKISDNHARHFKGKQLSAVHRQKISAAQKGKGRKYKSSSLQLKLF